MPHLVIAVPPGPLELNDSVCRLVAALQTHGYRVAVVEAPAEPMLARLEAQQMFVAYELTAAASAPVLLVVRLCPVVAAGGQRQAERSISLLAAPASLQGRVQWLLRHPVSFSSDEAIAALPAAAHPTVKMYRFIAPALSGPGARPLVAVMDKPPRALKQLAGTLSFFLDLRRNEAYGLN